MCNAFRYKKEKKKRLFPKNYFPPFVYLFVIFLLFLIVQEIFHVTFTSNFFSVTHFREINNNNKKNSLEFLSKRLVYMYGVPLVSDEALQ